MSRVGWFQYQGGASPLVSIPGPDQWMPQPEFPRRAPGVRAMTAYAAPVLVTPPVSAVAPAPMSVLDLRIREVIQYQGRVDPIIPPAPPAGIVPASGTVLDLSARYVIQYQSRTEPIVLAVPVWGWVMAPEFPIRVPRLRALTEHFGPVLPITTPDASIYTQDVYADMGSWAVAV